MSTHTLRIGHMLYTLTGGAGVATRRLHEALLAEHVDSKLCSAKTNSKKNHLDEHIEVVSINDSWALHEYSNNNIHEGNTIFSYPTRGLSKNELDKIVDMYDVINFHWIARFLSLENIAYLSHQGTPIVWTMHDKNIISGGCHCFQGCSKWQKDCMGCPQLKNTHNNMPAKILEAKKKYFNFENITVVVLNTAFKTLVEESPLFNESKIEVIPNSLDINIFTPYNNETDSEHKTKFLETHNIPENRILVLHVSGYVSRIKGYKEFIKMQDYLHLQHPQKYHLLIVGHVSKEENITLAHTMFGHIDEPHLIQLYQFCDVTVVSSIEDNSPNICLESISCGTPVVGFKVGGIPDMVIDGKTGYTVEVGDCEGLALAIEKVLDCPDLSASCRAHAEQHFTFELQATQYIELYTNLCSHANKQSDYNVPASFPELRELYIEIHNYAYKKLNDQFWHYKQSYEHTVTSYENTVTKLNTLSQAHDTNKVYIDYLETQLRLMRASNTYQFTQGSWKRKLWILVKVFMQKIGIYRYVQAIKKRH